jgi:hypothetical protein
MPRKEFDAFTRLDASDVNTFLMDQSVMTFGSATARDAAIDTPLEGQVTYLRDIDSLSVYNGTQWITNRPIMTFAGTAARGSAIPSPTLGMYTHLEDAPARTQFWNGSAWVSPMGLTLLNNTTFSASTLVRVNSIFTADYDSYLIRVQITANSANGVSLLRYLTAVNTPTSTTSYFRRGFFSDISTLGNYPGDNEPSILVGDGIAGSNGSSCELWVNNPFAATRTGLRGDVINLGSPPNQTLYSISVMEDTTRSFIGFEFAPNVGTITGNVQTYGYRKA